MVCAEHHMQAELNVFAQGSSKLVRHPVGDNCAVRQEVRQDASAQLPRHESSMHHGSSLIRTRSTVQQTSPGVWTEGLQEA